MYKLFSSFFFLFLISLNLTALFKAPIKAEDQIVKAKSKALEEKIQELSLAFNEENQNTLPEEETAIIETEGDLTNTEGELANLNHFTAAELEEIFIKRLYPLQDGNHERAIEILNNYDLQQPSQEFNLGKKLRVASFNVNRGYNIEKLKLIL